MNWSALAAFGIYAGIGLVALALWWVVYDLILTSGHSLREGLFGKRPNPAVALDFSGGVLALGVLIYAIVAGPRLESFAEDLEAVSLSLLVMILLLALLRMALTGLLRLWFRDRRDRPGDIVSLNNELFRQRNTASGVFAIVFYLVLASALVEQDFLDLLGRLWPATMNVLGVWTMGVAAVVAHSLFYLGLSARRNILHECFHDNNPAAAFSLLGLVAGMLTLNHGLIGGLRPGEHMFNTPELWYYLGAALSFVLVLRWLLWMSLRGGMGVDLGRELSRDNQAWGILDGALIFSLFLILIALIV